jgi:hypothetical protein
LKFINADLKKCIDGENSDFYFRPFTLTEAHMLFAQEEQKVTEEEFISCYYLTNGSPRYMLSYIQQGGYSVGKQ